MSAESLSTKVLALLAQTATQAQTKNELARGLGVPVDDRSALRQVLKDLVEEGKITEGDGRKFRLKVTKKENLLNGTLFIKPGGGGSFRPEQGDAENAAVFAAHDDSYWFVKGNLIDILIGFLSCGNSFDSRTLKEKYRVFDMFYFTYWDIKNSTR